MSLWVSKSDITAYIRCPYCWWVNESATPSDKAVDTSEPSLLLEAPSLQEEIESQGLLPVEASSRDLGHLKPQDLLLADVPIYKNPALLIRGCPRIARISGGLLPLVESASKRLSRSEELGLAFYWLLLEPYQRQAGGLPRGLIVTWGMAGPVAIEVPIDPRRMAQVRRLIEDVRRARQEGVRPRVSSKCRSCRYSPEVVRAAEENRDLTVVRGIGPNYALALEAGGISTYEELRAAKAEHIVGLLRARGYRRSEAEVEGWKLHGESLSKRVPLLLGTEPCVVEPFIALDLEYLPRGLIWLIGIRLANGKSSQELLLWSDDAHNQGLALRRLTDMLQQHPSLPIVTWAGQSADIPMLREAANSGSPGALQFALEQRHLDLHEWVRRSVLFPVARHGLKDLAAYLGIQRLSSVGDGLEAQALYGEYRSTTDANRKGELRKLLMEYNRDDLNSLVGIARRLRELGSEAGGT